MDNVRVDLAAVVVKAKGRNWVISSWQALEKQPEIAINGFLRTGILDAVIAVTKDRLKVKLCICERKGIKCIF